MKTYQRLLLVVLFATGLLVLLAPEIAYGYAVDPLPEDNLIVNPWFRSSTNPGMAGSDGWVFVPAENGVTWGLSQKESNPSPEIVVSGTCGFKNVYCGTGARWAHENNAGDTTAYPDVDVYMYQVVAANPAQHKLKFFMHWVNHKIDIFEVTIYGGTGPEGPWINVWDVVSISQDMNPPPGQAPGRQGIPWFTTGILDSVLPEGYPYYKIELHARYPEGRTDQGDVGVKVTGIYFATEFTEEAVSQSTPAIIHNPTVMPPPGSTAVPATNTPPAVAQGGTETGGNGGQTPATGIAPPTSPPSATFEAEVPTTEPTVRVRPTRTAVVTLPTPVPAVEEGSSGLGQGFILGLLAGGLLVGLFLVVRALAARTG